MSKAIICMYHISIISIKNLDIYQGPLQNIFFFFKNGTLFACTPHTDVICNHF